MHCNKIKIDLEEMFSIPFLIDEPNGLGQPEFIIVPADVESEEAFSVRIAFYNNIRAVMEFIPSRFCANMIRSMGNASEEKKRSFVAYATNMINQNAQCRFLINGTESDPLDYMEWPVNWTNLELRVTKRPIVLDDNDSIDYADIAIHWGGYILGMILSLLDIVPVEETSVTGYEEGKGYIIQSKRYERNPLNRTACILAKGTSCSVCGMNFQSTYGELGSGFIHVHHIIPVSKMGEGYIVDPVNDLVPVCPNCHAMLHKTDPPRGIEQLKTIYISNRL